MDPIISILDLGMSFPGKQAGSSIEVLQGIDLQIFAGEFVCFVGPSGCGKSTLLNIIAGFLRPTKGQVLFHGRPIHGPDPKRIFVFQENAAFPWLTVEENVGFGLRGLPEDQKRTVIRHYVEMVGLAGFEKAYPRELSGGMKQRVEIARALAPSPDVVYMDEPFGALDFITRLKMRADLIRIWQNERKTVLFVTHDIEESIQLADRVIVMGKRSEDPLREITVGLDRPRDLDSPDYIRLRDGIFETMGMSLRIGS